jgi:hypothetical protein
MDRKILYFMCWTLKMKTIRCPEYPVTNQGTPRNKPEERVSQAHRGDFLKGSTIRRGV